MKIIAKLGLLAVISAFLATGAALAQSTEGIEAPVYKESDYWTFQFKRVKERPDDVISSDALPNTPLTIRYTGNGFMIEGYYYQLNNLSDRVPTIHIPKGVPWLQFPLVKNREWSYSYLDQKPTKGSRMRWDVIFSVDSEKKITVSAGAFSTMSISSIASGGKGRRTSIYNYSPLTKTVVSGRVVGLDGTRYEIELLAYGNKSEGDLVLK